ncbi:hypothetical protein [Metabacillus indicus]|uniref:hypothetical protein n=1 Tax=Metabacillus indicus TaxID=246786 RepID=UPI003CEF73B0
MGKHHEDEEVRELVITASRSNKTKDEFRIFLQWKKLQTEVKKQADETFRSLMK